MTAPLSTWLPAELTTEQPYSMCPLLGWHCVLNLPSGSIPLAFPATGGRRAMDAPFELHAALMWQAPAKLRKAARDAGLPTPRLLVPGLAEAFERNRAAREVAHV